MDHRLLKKLITATALIIICTGCRDGDHHRRGIMLTKEQIIKKANEVIVAEGFSLDTMSLIYADPANREWEDMLTQLARTYPDPNFAIGYRKLLKDRNYQAIWYIPDPKKIMAGRLCVFVDKYTGEVIGFSGGL